MNDELTAFRIRGDNQNMSAPRSDTELRSQFEWAQILRRFRAMPTEVLEETFAQDLAERKIEVNTVPDIWLAELALTGPHPAQRLFALETLFETAHSNEDLRRLRYRLGTIDVFGIQEARRRDARIGELDGELAAANAKLDAMGLRTRELQESLQRLTNSRSWRLTAPLRALSGALKRS